MQFTVLKWVREFLLLGIARTLEVLFRILLLITPLGVYLFVIQGRSKASSVSSLSAFTNDKSVWQHIFPGFMLVSVDKNQFKTSIIKIRDNVQSWIRENKPLLDVLLMLCIVLVLIILEIRK